MRATQLGTCATMTSNSDLRPREPPVTTAILLERSKGLVMQVKSQLSRPANAGHPVGHMRHHDKQFRSETTRAAGDDGDLVGEVEGVGHASQISIVTARKCGPPSWAHAPP